MNTEAFYGHWIKRSAFCLVAFCLLLEVATRIGFSRVSHIESRIKSEHKAASTLRKTPGKKTILLLGNSLALEGVALPQLHSRIEPRARVVRFVIEATEYLDWYYGIRRLLAEGSDPDVILLCIDTTHLKSAGIRGDYSSFYLFQTSDLPFIAKAAHYDLTNAAGLFLARYSLFYAGRTGIRNFVLNHADDPYAEMVRNLPKQAMQMKAQSTTDPNILSLETKRLNELREQCAAYGKKLIFLLPPGKGDDEEQLRLAAKRANSDLFIPAHQNEFTSNLFRDGYHLNDAGASIFTDRLAGRLNTYLNRTLQ